MKKAFTLAEVLITLGIIGVVAAMTMPVLVAKYQEKVFVTRLKNVQSIFSQAFLNAINDNGDLTEWECLGTDTPANSKQWYNYFKPYLKLIEDCGENSGCFADKYTAMFSDKPMPNGSPKTNRWVSKGRLANGVSFAIWRHYSCTIGTLTVDLNGQNKPNRAGVDYFAFTIDRKGITPCGPSSTWICEYNNPANNNGSYCTKWVLLHENMDYLRRDISDEW